MVVPSGCTKILGPRPMMDPVIDLVKCLQNAECDACTIEDKNPKTLGCMCDVLYHLCYIVIFTIPLVVKITWQSRFTATLFMILSPFCCPCCCFNLVFRACVPSGKFPYMLNLCDFCKLRMFLAVLKMELFLNITSENPHIHVIGL